MAKDYSECLPRMRLPVELFRKEFGRLFVYSLDTETLDYALKGSAISVFHDNIKTCKKMLLNINAY